jgi:hypothetical protein
MFQKTGIFIENVNLICKARLLVFYRVEYSVTELLYKNFPDDIDISEIQNCCKQRLKFQCI